MVYGPDFKTIKCISLKDNEIWVNLDSYLPESEFVIDPTILDGVFQSFAAFALEHTDDDAFLGFSAERIHLHGKIICNLV